MDTTAPGVGQFNFLLKQGADTTISMIWLNDDGVTPMPLQGYSFALVIREYVGNPIALLSINSSTQSGSRIVAGGNDGSIDLVFARQDTAGLQASGVAKGNLFGGLPIYKLGVYDLQYTDPSGNVGYLLEGSITLDPRVT